MMPTKSRDSRLIEPEAMETRKATMCTTDSFEAEVVPHIAILRQTALRLVRNTMDAEDLVQETLVRAFRFWDRYTPGSNCRAWLFQILRNQYINEYRVKSRRPLVIDIDSLEEGYLYRQSSAAGGHRTPEEVLFDRYVDDDLLEAVHRLRDEFRHIAILFFFRGHSYKQIARMEKLNVGTVKSRLYRGRKVLRASLLDYARRNRYVSACH